MIASLLAGNIAANANWLDLRPAPERMNPDTKRVAPSCVENVLVAESTLTANYAKEANGVTTLYDFLVLDYRAIGWELEDTAQELSFTLMSVIERYDPDRGASQATYYIKMLRYGLLNIWREQMRAKRLANLHAASFTRANEDDEVVELELPLDVDYDMHVRINEFMRTLSPGEQNALARTVSGDGPDDKRHNRFMAIVSKKPGAMGYQEEDYNAEHTG